MPGQADTAPTLDDVAAFLVDNPEADKSEAPPDDKEPAKADNSDADAVESPSPDDGTSPDEEEEDSEEESDESETAKSQTSLKWKVPVKGEDGAESTIEVDEKELIAGYQRRADYTRKTQELGEREREAHAVVDRKLNEGRDHYMQTAELALRAVQQLAGLRSDAEMAALATSDPSLWVAERQRTDAINTVMAQIQQGMQAEKQQAEKKTAEQIAHQKRHAWGVLGQQGIDEAKLVGIYKGIAKHYGVELERFENVTDPRLVLIMRDAMVLRELKDKAPAVQKKVQAAPKLPAARQSVPKSEQINKRLDQRFKSGKASTRDLAAFIATNNL